MTTTYNTAASDPRREPISHTCHRLRRSGFSDGEAANLAALVNGLAINAHPWKLRELANLLFLRWLRRTRRVWSDADDRAPADVGGGWRAPGRTPRHLSRSDRPITMQLLLRATSDRTAQMPQRAAGSPSEKGREGR